MIIIYVYPTELSRIIKNELGLSEKKMNWDKGFIIYKGDFCVHFFVCDLSYEDNNWFTKY